MNLFSAFENKKDSAAAITNEALEYELKIRNSVGVFPLHVFHDDIKGYLTTLVEDYDLPRSYVGTSMISAYSTAIGTAAAVYESEIMPNYLATWICLVGVSSAGKSLVNNFVYRPIFERQYRYDKEWDTLTEEMTPAQRMQEVMPTIVFRDVHMATLMRNVLPDNPKGLIKDADELLEWVNGMNQMAKKGDGTDEQIWLSSWNCRSFSAIRSGKDKYVIRRPYMNIMGGVQPSVAPKLFSNNRDTTGFIFRVLFAPPERHRIAQPKFETAMNPNFMAIHTDSLTMMLDMVVRDDDQEPWKIYLSKDALRLKRQWIKKTVDAINEMKEIAEIEIHSGIFGKIQEYINRFAGILKVSDVAYNNLRIGVKDINVAWPEEISGAVMERALALADYYYKSAAEMHRIVSVDLVVPAKVVTLSLMWRTGKSLSQMADFYFGDSGQKQKIKREIEKMVKKYPRVFGAKI